MSASKGTDKENVVYSTIEYCPALEILTHATIWMNLKDTMLREVSQSQFHFYKVNRLVKFMETENRRVATLLGYGGMGS